MIACENLFEIFKKNDLVYFSGVPDSTFKQWMSYLAANSDMLTNRIASNEGAAVAHAAGYYLATNKIGVVYLQNSGIGNCINPLTSLADPEVFSIPMILMTGWRGEPGKKDEPQHKKMGRIMLPLLKKLEIYYEILEEDKIKYQIEKVKNKAVCESMPVALIVRNELLEEYDSGIRVKSDLPLTKDQAIRAIIDSFNGNEIIVATTGKTSRELFEYREECGTGHSNDFYTVGSMGHCSSIALEIAKQKPEKKIYVFDGDGSVIMHMGTLATIGFYAPNNLIHIVFDNNAYESTGGQPTVSDKIDIASIALGCGYSESITCLTVADILTTLKKIKKCPTIIVIKIKKGSRENLIRPTITPEENKRIFIDKLRN
ncbi:MAG: phosphonopyruvate decarboxylase [Gammaproteobacteria bacterium]|nr:phosphonopyruvate decarboxylase [Gammaproteobacteria bacterium]HJP17174.1 phosphonopyruvate decarboxylase [Nitrospinota bacterium]|tara:strand:+ start:44357 stop:45472 length:1116 start_codon:yes stop_codon:yes gene_type:complete